MNNQKNHPMFLHVWIRLNRTNSEGKSPLLIRITLAKKRVETFTGIYIEPTHWDGSIQRVKPKAPNAKSLNEEIQNELAKLRAVYARLDALGNAITAELIRDTHQEKVTVEKKKTVGDAFDLHNQLFEIEMAAERVTRSTYSRYLLGKVRVLAFIKKKYHRPDLNLDEVDSRFLLELEEYLKTTYTLSHNMTTKYLKQVKKVFSVAYNEKWITWNPFTISKLYYDPTKPRFLTEEELERMENYDFSRQPELERVRDCFIFCCYTAISFGDAQRLTFNDVLLDSGSKVFDMDRGKTGVPFYVPILQTALDIIEKYAPWRAQSGINGRLLPFPSNQFMNRTLKAIATVCNITSVELQSHAARHTFASTIAVENGLPVETIQRVMGHTTIRTTMIYTKTSRKKIRADMQVLQNTLSEKKMHVVPDTKVG